MTQTVTDNQNRPHVQALTIAGSDSGGGAGIQADLKTFQERRVFGLSVVTAVTAQNTLGVTDIHAIPLPSITAQLAAIAADFSPSAFKIGMLGTAETIDCVANGLREHDFGLCVLDPVMIAKGGAPLLDNDALETLKTTLVPLANVITPNIPEARCLTGIDIVDESSYYQAGEALLKLGAENAVIKGGHADGNNSVDYIFTAEGISSVSAKRFATPHTHGTGCTFSACMAAELAKGANITYAIATAKAFITAAISHPLGIGAGHGPTNHWAYRDH